jgi:hypothetical protein
LTSGIVFNDSSILLASASGDIRSLDSDETTSLLVATLPEPLLVASSEPSVNDEFIVVSRLDGRILLLYATGGNERIIACPQLTNAVNITSLSKDRLLGVMTDGEGRHYLQVVNIARAKCAWTRPEFVMCAIGAPSVVSSGEGIAVLACGEPSTPLRLVTLDGQSLTLTEISGSQPPRAPLIQDEALWFGMPLVKVNHGYLRVVADLRSNVRWIQYWNAAGRYERSQIIDEPLGLVASSLDGTLLLGVNGVDSVGVVLFAFSRRAAAMP